MSGIPNTRHQLGRVGGDHFIAVVDDAVSPEFPLGDSLEGFVRREEAERFNEEGVATSPRWRRPCGSRSASLMRAG
jgi:hypothetical protein